MEQPISEKDYRSRWDAETLATAKEIETDPTRLASAQTAATKLADEDSKKAKHMRQVARKKGNPKFRSPYASEPTKPTQGNTQGNQHNVFQRI